jgi:cyclopropane fatty-acyl-phospholipid synthase-like methyltransferase
MKPQVLTDNPVAFHSPDHLEAAHSGSGNDNSINPPFNAKLKRLYEDRPIAVLDVGCAGGGFVKSLIDDGHFAVGLEGSDYSLLKKRAEWATIPDFLFTCDATKPFTVYDSADPATPTILFDVITFWEVMEHFSAEELPAVIANVLRHLKPDGLWIMSVSTQQDGNRFHRCVKDRPWWLKMFADAGLEHREDIREFFNKDWVRGPDPTPWAITAGESFHLVMKRKAA